MQLDRRYIVSTVQIRRKFDSPSLLYGYIGSSPFVRQLWPWDGPSMVGKNGYAEAPRSVNFYTMVKIRVLCKDAIEGSTFEMERAMDQRATWERVHR